MPVAPTDAFRESAKKDFIESPNHERNDEAGLTLTDGLASYYVGVTMNRAGLIPSTSYGLMGRELDDAIFLKRETTWENTVDPATGLPSSMTHTVEYTIYGALVTDSFSGSATVPDVSSWTVVSTTVISDDDNEAHAVVVYTNGTNTHTVTERCTIPVLSSDIFDIITPFYEAKFAAASVAPGDGSNGELWSPDTSGTFSSVSLTGAALASHWPQKWATSSMYYPAAGYIGPYDVYTISGVKEVVYTTPTTSLFYRIRIIANDYGSVTLTIPPPVFPTTTNEFIVESAGNVYEVEPNFDSYNSRSVFSRIAASPPP